VDAAARERLQWQLPSNIFIQFLVGPPGIRGGAFGTALRAIAWITLVIAPVLLLLTMQVQFLPFHSHFINRTQRIALIVDLVLLGWLWRRVLSGRELGGPFRASWVWPILGVALGLAVILFSWTVATFPGEPQEDLIAGCSGCGLASSLRERIFESQVDPTNRRRQLPFSNRLVLTGFNVLESLGINDPDKAKWRDYIFRTRARDLKGARFDFASLPRVDFAGANLQGASFDHTQLDRVSFDGAQLRDASLVGASLQGASLNGAQLQGAQLQGSRLWGASLFQAQLQGAGLQGAQLQGASLDEAQLQGASLLGAHLQGASLKNAQLQGALLTMTQLQGASLWFAQLQATSLNNAWLSGASFTGAQLQGASMQGASLIATDLSNAYLWRANGSPQTVTAVRLSDAAETWVPRWKGTYDPQVRQWNDEAYRDMRKAMELVPPGAFRDGALESLRSLDCANRDPTLSSCDPSVPPPGEAAAWRKSLQAARVDDADYAKALAAVLRTLVCSGDDHAGFLSYGVRPDISFFGLGSASYILRGLTSPIPGFPSRLATAGPEAPALIDFIMSRDCPVSTSLTDDDRANLLRIKQDAEKTAK
jgi:uncharacterized protein YjbI with pentapeptide repeats